MSIRTKWIVVVAGAAALVVGVASLASAAPMTTRVSVNGAGRSGNHDSGTSAVSGNGTAIAFTSTASNLVPGDTNGEGDVFVRDRRTNSGIERVSVSGTGKQANRASHSTAASISNDGRYVVFESVASNLVPGDTNHVSDVFLRDRTAHTTVRVSVNSAGRQGNADSFNPTISIDGRFVVYASAATNLVPGDTNGFMDVFVWDRLSRATRRVSVSRTGAQGNDDSIYGVAGAKGDVIYFESHASNLVPGDVHSDLDVFVLDTVARTVERVSVDNAGHELPDGANGGLSINAVGSGATFLSGGARPQVYLRYPRLHTTMLVSVNDAHRPGNGGSGSPSFSPTGAYVAFSSLATNLVPGVSGPQVYLRDLGAGKTILVSANNSGRAGNGQSMLPSASLTGVSFTSSATNLAAGSTGGHLQVYFRAR
jgi:Tol biopolymer transport system component